MTNLMKTVLIILGFPLRLVVGIFFVLGSAIAMMLSPTDWKHLKPNKRDLLAILGVKPSIQYPDWDWRRFNK
jgi:hypothetical protein